MVNIQPATADNFNDVLAWLKTENKSTGEGFYCNRGVIWSFFIEGNGLCVTIGGTNAGFAVFEMFSEKGKIQIIEVEPSHRMRGIGSLLLLAAIDVLRRLGALYVEVECTSTKGEAFFRSHGFEIYIDPRNYRSQWDNPFLRLYLSEWRPPDKGPNYCM